MSKEDKILNRVKEHYLYLRNKGYEIVFIALQGSQNYGLDVYTDEYMSDVDTKAIVLPSFEDFVYNRTPVSKTIILDNNEHIDVKDVRVMFETYKKQNVNFIETLFTNYKIINSKYMDLVQPLFDSREDIAHINVNQALRCMAGMSMEKLKALQHPYPTIIDKIEKYGYDPKQLHHILRMNDFIKKYVKGLPYEECLIPDEKDYLIKVKTTPFKVDLAVALAQTTDIETKKIKDDNVTEQDTINQKGIEVLNQVKFNLLKQKFEEDIGEK